MSPLLLTVLAASALSAARPAPGSNPELAKAEKFFEMLKYTEAETALKNAIGVPRNDRKTVLRIYELRGIVDATMGKPSALDHFRKLVALDPEHVLSRDLGPRILAPFYEAKGRLTENPPIQLLTTSAWSEGSLKLRVTVQSDKLRLATKMAIGWRLPNGQWTSKVQPVKPEVEQSVQGDAVDWYVNLLGVYDGVVMEAGSEANPLKAPSVLPPPLVREDPVGLTMPVAPPMSARRKIALGTMGAGAGALIAAGACGLSSRSARSQFDNPQRDELGRLIGITADRTRALEAQAVSTAIAANVLAVSGAALVGLGAILWFGDSSGRVALVPSFGGVTLVGTLP